jgi:hypothetical protein
MGKSTSRDTSKERDSITNTLAPKPEANRAARRTAEQEAWGRQPASVYWLITRNEYGRLMFLALSLTGGEEMLPVFSSEEEAEMFFSLGQVGLDRWQARQSTVGELISESTGLLCRCEARGPRPVAGDARREYGRAREPESGTLCGSPCA